MSTILVLFIGLLLLLFLFIIWRWIATSIATQQRDQQIEKELQPMAIAFENKRPIDQQLINKLAINPAVRYRLYRLLCVYENLQFMPKKYLTLESFFEAQLCFWLLHQNELGKVPDEIQFVEKITKQSNNFYVYKLKTHQPHWAAKDGWLAGIVGPCPDYQELKHVIRNNLTHAFSRFEKFDEAGADEHVRKFCRTLNIN